MPKQALSSEIKPPSEKETRSNDSFADLSMCSERIRELVQQAKLPEPRKELAKESPSNERVGEVISEMNLLSQDEMAPLELELGNCDEGESHGCFDDSTKTLTIAPHILKQFERGGLSPVVFGGHMVHEAAHALGASEYCAHTAQEALKLKYGAQTRFQNEDQVLKLIAETYPPVNYLTAVLERYNGEVHSENRKWLPGGEEFLEQVPHRYLPPMFEPGKEEEKNFENLVLKHQWPPDSDPRIAGAALSYHSKQRAESQQNLLLQLQGEKEIPSDIANAVGKTLWDFHELTTDEVKSERMKVLEQAASTSLAVSRTAEVFHSLRPVVGEIPLELDKTIAKSRDSIASWRSTEQERAQFLRSSPDFKNKYHGLMEELGEIAEGAIATMHSNIKTAWKDEYRKQMIEQEMAVLSDLEKIQKQLRGGGSESELHRLENRVHESLTTIANLNPARFKGNHTMFSTLTPSHQQLRERRLIRLGETSMLYLEHGKLPFGISPEE